MVFRSAVSQARGPESRLAAEGGGASGADAKQPLGAGVQSRARSREPQSEEVVGLGGAYRDGDRHRSTGAIPRLLRADGAGTDGESRLDAAPGPGRCDARRGTL